MTAHVAMETLRNVRCIRSNRDDHQAHFIYGMKYLAMSSLFSLHNFRTRFVGMGDGHGIAGGSKNSHSYSFDSNTIIPYSLLATIPR